MKKYTDFISIEKSYFGKEIEGFYERFEKIKKLICTFGYGDFKHYHTQLCTSLLHEAGQDLSRLAAEIDEFEKTTVLDNVKILVKPKDLWQFCQDNKEDLRERSFIVARTGDSVNDLVLNVTLNNFDNDEADDFVLTLEDGETIINSEQFSSTATGCVQNAKAKNANPTL